MALLQDLKGIPCDSPIDICMLSDYSHLRYTRLCWVLSFKPQDNFTATGLAVEPFPNMGPTKPSYLLRHLAYGLE